MEKWKSTVCVQGVTVCVQGVTVCVQGVNVEKAKCVNRVSEQNLPQLIRISSVLNVGTRGRE